MFQTFDVTANYAESAARVARLRAGFASASIDGFIVPRADEHQGEYIADSAARLGWLTGFTGSAGTALVLSDAAFIFVDGRYTLQVRDQVDTAVFEPVGSVETPLPAFLRERRAPLAIGFDPWLHTVGEVRALSEALEAAGGRLVPLASNPVDAIWTDRPAAPLGPVRLHPIRLAGEEAAAKLERLRTALGGDRIDLTVLTDPSSIAWTFNIRGSDVAHTPLPLGFAILPAEGRPSLFIDAAKLSDEVAAVLHELAEIRPPADLLPALAELSQGRRVGLDSALAAERLRMTVEAAGGTVVAFADPARLPRARKNAAEIAGSRAAHRRDGAAVTAFLHWLSIQAPGSFTEIDAAERLERFRVETGEAAQMPLKDVSFDTIAGAGPNGAIIHYRVNRTTNRTVAAGELFLVDSGGQYEDGTTDITRTVAVGEPTAEMRQRFTLVLKGMIAITRLRFPKGTRGIDIDAFARVALWQAGCDYAHGTGHGVGAYLAVHEGPQSISRRGMAVLEAGMICSNEPGYYRQGAYGIRIENLVLVEEAAPVPGGDLPMHAFETLTLAPIDRALMDLSLMAPEDLAWLDAYHARVRDEIGPLLAPDAAAWLAETTKPLGGS